MFKEMRRKNRELSHTQSIEILNQGEYGILSTIGTNGYPYGVPMSYSYFNDVIYFHCAKLGAKLDNLTHCDKVSFTVVGKTQIIPEQFSTAYESVIIFGKATEVYEDEKTNALFKLIEKYSPNHLESGKTYIEKAAIATKVFKIEIEHLTAKGRTQ